MTSRTLASRCAAALSVAALTLLPLAGPAVSAGATAPAPGPAGSPASTAVGPQAELDRVMALQPGGIQVSDNAVVWGDADVVLVVPDKGETTAPAGLGDDVRRGLLDTPAMRSLEGSSARGGSAALDTHGCPGGYTTKDYYCFYQYADFGGRRVQFTGATKEARADDWGFNNGTSSWVSNDVDCEVKTYDTFEGSLLWRQPENSVSRFVGGAHDNKLSWWTCSTQASGRQATAGPQPELDRAMALQPGGVQVSDNAVVWGDGDVVLVVPDRGETTAPAGLGDGVRRGLLDTPALRSLATGADDGATARGPSAALDTHGCPGGVTTKDYYCFYQYSDFGGRRVQFTGDTKAADAADWGFDNGTSSWVTNDVDCTVRAYNAERPADMDNWMWRAPENSVSRYVGATNDNKLSFWTCNGDG